MNKSINWIIFLPCLAIAFYMLESAIAPFFISFIIAYLTHPLVQKLASKFNHKSIIIAIIIAVMICMCATFVMLVVPIVYEQTSLLVSKVPAYKEYLQPIITEKVNHLHPDVSMNLSKALHSSFDKVVAFMASVFNNILSHFLGTISTIAMVFIIPVITFYMLRDFSSLKNSTRQLLPDQLQTKVPRILSEIDNLLSAYVRGQLKVCIIMATYYSCCLKLAGLDLALLLGIISGMAIILPFVGFLLSLILSSIFGYITFGISYHLLAILGIYLFGAVLEGGVLTPKIIGDKIGLHPLWIIFAILAGGTLFGFVGMLLAIPIAGICKILFKFIIKSDMSKL